MQYTITSSTKKIPIYFGNKSSENLKKYIDAIEFDKLIVITDTNVQGLRGEQLKSMLSPPLRFQFFTINPGEKYKTFETYQKLCDDILQFGISRKSLIIAFGGGVVGNIAGFVASTLLRGIKFIHIPTTIIAQADSTTGGKQAINSQYGKNLIGTFYEPEFILIDSQYLTTLPKREIRCGIAECIKHALCQDNNLLEKLENENFDIDFLKDIIQKTIILKINTIEKDRKEHNLGKVLVYGHTIGHALEILLKGEMNHGESISIGMCCVAKIAHKLGFLNEEDMNTHFRILENWHLPTKIPQNVSVDNIIQQLVYDKKIRNSNDIELILLKELGEIYSQDNKVGFAITKEKLKEYLLLCY